MIPGQNELLKRYLLHQKVFMDTAVVLELVKGESVYEDAVEEPGEDVVLPEECTP